MARESFKTVSDNFKRKISVLESLDIDIIILKMKKRRHFSLVFIIRIDITPLLQFYEIKLAQKAEKLTSGFLRNSFLFFPFEHTALVNVSSFFPFVPKHFIENM